MMCQQKMVQFLLARILILTEVWRPWSVHLPSLFPSPLLTHTTSHPFGNYWWVFFCCLRYLNRVTLLLFQPWIVFFIMFLLSTSIWNLFSSLSKGLWIKSHRMSKTNNCRSFNYLLFQSHFSHILITIGSQSGLKPIFFICWLAPYVFPGMNSARFDVSVEFEGKVCLILYIFWFRGCNPDLYLRSEKGRIW